MGPSEADHPSCKTKKLRGSIPFISLFFPPQSCMMWLLAFPDFSDYTGCEVCSCPTETHQYLREGRKWEAGTVPFLWTLHCILEQFRFEGTLEWHLCEAGLMLEQVVGNCVWISSEYLWGWQLYGFSEKDLPVYSELPLALERKCIRIFLNSLGSSESFIIQVNFATSKLIS